MYDQEFEKFWDLQKGALTDIKSFAYLAWKAAIETKPENKKIELEGGEWFINGNNEIFTGDSSCDYRNSGHERKTKEDTIKAAELMRKRDRLAAFVYEHCGFEGEWNYECNHYIYIDADGEYCHVPEDEFPDLCKQYMPKDTAIWLCEKLNSGEIVL